MKSSCRILLLLILSTPAYCQIVKAPVTLTLSQTMNEPDNSTISDYLGGDDEGYYLLRSIDTWNPTFILEAYDKKMQLRKSQELNPEIERNKTEISKVVFLGNQLYVFFIIKDKKAHNSILYFQQIDKKTLELTGNPNLVVSIPNKTFYTGSFAYDISRGKGMLSVMAITRNEKNVPQKFNLVVMNDQMTKQWEKEITLPYASDLFEEERTMVDNSGNVYILGRLYKDFVLDDRRGEPNYVYKILSYRDQGATQKEYDITLKDNFITGLGFNITDDGHMVCGGFYSEKGIFSIKGTYFILLDANTQEVINEEKKAFEAGFLEMFRSFEKTHKGAELYNYDYSNLIVRSDGGALLLAEQYEVKTSTGKSASNTYYIYNDMIAINVNPDMSIKWATKIPKKQITVNDWGIFSSYEYAIVHDKIYLIFNDNPDNLQEADPQRIKNFNGKSSVATLITINADGKWNKSLLFSNRDEGVILRPKICEQISDNEFFLYAERGKDYVIGKIDL